MSNIINIPTICEKVATRRDGSLVVSFATDELSPATMASLFQVHNKYCYVAIKPEDFNPNELDKLARVKVDFDDKTKSPSQRLRGVFYRMFELDNEGFNSFTKYYDHKMEKVIEHFKTKLP